MTFLTYAQNFEDVLLWRALKDVPSGFYIDVGANDPELHSVTKAFYDHGWSGINIEPMPSYRAAFAEQRPRDINLNVAAGAASGSITLFDVPEVNGWASTDARVADGHRAHGHAVVEHTVPLVTLAEVCREHVRGPVHFLKIDVEGHEAEVLRGMDFSLCRPWIVVVEAILPNSRDSNHGDWEALVTAHGYQYAWFDGLNRYYVADEQSHLAAALQLQPNVFDEFIPHHLDKAWRRGAQLARQVEADGRQASEQDARLRQLGQRQAELEQELGQRNQLLAELDRTLAQRDQTLAEREQLLDRLNQTLAEHDQLHLEREQLLASLNQTLAEHDQQLIEREQLLASLNQTLAEHDQQLIERNELLAEQDRQLVERDRMLAERDRTLAQLERALAERDQTLAAREQLLAEREQQLSRQQQTLLQRDQDLRQRQAQVVQLEAELRQSQEEARQFEQRMHQAAAWGSELEQRLLAVYASTSWRITEPMRAIMRRGEDSLANRTRRGARAALRDGARWLTSRQWLRRALLPLIARSPLLQGLVHRSLHAVQAGTAPAAGAAEVPYQLRELPQSARKVLDDLQRARHSHHE